MTTNPSCAGNDGSISLTVTGGTCDYTYAWSDGLDGTPFQNGLTAGTYFVTITDCLDSMMTSSIELQETIITVDPVTVEDVSCFGANDGQIDLTVTNGTAPYTFDWDNDGIGDNDDPEDLTDLPVGTYSVVITDANGCTVTLSVTLNEPEQPEIDDNCDLTEDSFNEITCMAVNTPTCPDGRTFNAATCNCDTEEIFGCTDPCATNYNPDATQEDGSCILNCDSDCVTIEECDDGDPCTVNDTETLAADGTLCTECKGVPISEEENMPIDVPEGITPHTPGVGEDILEIPDFNSGEFTVTRMMIFNRNGGVVYKVEKQQGQPWTPEDWWNGRCNTGNCNGELLPQAAYYYIIDYGTECFSGYTQKGSIFIL